MNRSQWDQDLINDQDQTIAILRSEVSDLENKLTAAETERDAALFQMRANAKEIDRAAGG